MTLEFRNNFFTVKGEKFLGRQNGNKGCGFFERGVFFKSPNLQNRNIPKNYPELEI